MKLNPEPIVNALHRADSTVHFRLDPADFAIRHDDETIMPTGFQMIGDDLIVSYPHTIHINDVLPD